MDQPAIQGENLTKYYGRRRGVEDLNLEVRPGEVFGFLGPNGAGKTTTIRLLLDLIRPTRGRLRVLGLDPRTQGVQLRRRVGYLPGELAMEGRQTAGELLEFYAHLRGGVDRRWLGDLVERLDLDRSQRIGSLSKGNKQKVGLVQAFMHRPDLLILDEPTSGLDPLMQREFLALVRQARERGQTVFMSSHVLAEVQEAADRVGIIRAGRLITVEEVHALRGRALRRVEITFDVPVPAEAFCGLPDVRDVQVEGATLRCVVDGRADALVKAASKFPVMGLRSEEPDLDEIFVTYYQADEEERHGA